ncbi:hypothetical protein UFOVP236_36 [uncultured Caudovirales phage]|uniref:Glycine-rich domain-containing protein n=1 Tax=uncultured Caudovirales phage TaxID=2100421 RepID=A0A6J7WR22_9CAUD|nr:hypothetical protein UFOVP236_36 [uncultured Caudovirales phage]
MSYLGNGPGVASQRITDTFSVTTSTTTFTPSSGYTIGYLDVYHNGVKLVNGDDYTASNGSTFALTSAAQNGDTVECVAYIPRGLSDGYTKAEADAKYPLKPTGTPTGGKFLRDDNTWQTLAVTPTAVSDQDNTSTGAFDVPSGTTAQRPATPSIGYLRYNTDIGALENYTATGWLKVAVLPPLISSVSGAIYSSAASSLTFVGQNFGTSSTVIFVSGATTASVSGTPVGGQTSLTVSVPAAIYGLSSGSSINITVTNSDGATSAAYNMTSYAPPTGGVITQSGNYRYHEFKSTANFVTSRAITAEIIVVAGGGGGGYDLGGGGGAGGLIYSASTALSVGTYTATIGGGGSGSPTTAVNGTNGSNSSFTGLTTAIGGGGGGSYNTASAGSSGGSGGGGGTNQNAGGAGGSGTAGQGNAGGAGVNGFSDGNYGITGGGGGAGAAGSAGNAANNGKGGDGLYYANFTAWGYPAGWFAGGGGGASDNNGPAGVGGSGGGGTGNSSHGVAYTGGGGGGPGVSTSGYNGGSGIVLIRYAL